MAELDFTIESQIYTNDELGELSLSLNKLSTNLQENMDELKKANAKLKDDIKKKNVNRKAGEGSLSQQFHMS
ncbi:hypothetical protein KHA80_05820 [Anaerobacillus sp. HL2]|nr:hypothetical protein KHA80_05820 [Anaerobacillus sp. HL2]